MEPDENKCPCNKKTCGCAATTDCPCVAGEACTCEECGCKRCDC